MTLDRRGFIRIAGSSAIVLAAGGGVGGFALTHSPDRALAPWRAAGAAYADARMRWLGYAILAPNPHNRQPWLADLRADRELMLYCDPKRLLPETDPFNRQIVIGLGCFLELLAMAAAEDGWLAEIEPFPEGAPAPRLDGRPVARVRFRRSDDARPDPLFAHVLDRRSNKQPFDTARAVAEGTLRALRAAAGDRVSTAATNDAPRVARLRDLTWRAHLVEVTTPRTYLESVRLMRIGKAEIEASPDGIDIGGAGLEAMKLVGLLNRERIADPTSLAFEQGLDMFRPIMGSAMAYLWIATDANRRIDQLEVGRAWVRANLKATALGLGVHPLSQALQEYSEMAALYDELHTALGVTGGRRVQMLGRLGYGETVGPSPRWPAATRIRPA